jgi:hypothetical protein
VVVVVAVNCGAVVPGGIGVEDDWDWDWDCASAASKSMLKYIAKVWKWFFGFGFWFVGEAANLLDFGLEVLFFFGCALDCAGVFCV